MSITIESIPSIFLDVSLKALLLVFVAWGAVTLLRVKSATVQHRVWSVVLGGMLFLPLLVQIVPAVPLPHWLYPQLQFPSGDAEASLAEPELVDDHTAGSSLPLQQPVIRPVYEPPSADGGSPSPMEPEQAGRISLAPRKLPETSHNLVEPRSTTSPTTAVGGEMNANMGLVAALACYLFVTCVLLLRLVVGIVKSIRLARRAQTLDVSCRGSTLPRGTTVAASEEIRVPLTVGLVRPMILLPADWHTWGPAAMEMVIAHEAEHIRRRDGWTQLMANINAAFYWFHPVAWIVRRRLADLAEHICDDQVIRATGMRSDYATKLLEMASRLSSPTRLVPAVGMPMARRPQIETRIDWIIDRERPLAQRIGAGVALLLAAIGLPAIVITAGLRPTDESLAAVPQATEVPAANEQNKEVDEEIENGTLPLVLGSVTTPDGRPAIGADVTLVGGSYGEPEQLGATTTDATGKFAFHQLPDEETVFADPGQLSVWVIDTEGRIGWFNDLHHYRHKPVAVQLQEVADVTGRLLDNDDRPIVGATLRPEILMAKHIGKNRVNYAQFSPQMRQRFTVTTDSEGQFVIPKLPSNGAVTVKVAAAGFGEPRIGLNVGQPLLVRLQRAAQLASQIDWPAGMKLPDDFAGEQLGTISLWTSTSYDASGKRAESSDTSAYRVSFTDHLTIDRDGRFGHDALPPGEYRLTASFEPGVPLVPPPASQLTLEPGQAITDHRLPAQAALRIEGRVLAAADRSPIAGAEIEISLIQDGTLMHERRATTDENGHYVVHVKPGTIRISVTGASAEYVPLDSSVMESELAKQRRPTIDVKEDTTWPDLLLDSASDVVLEVVDLQGRPVAGAVIDIVTAVGYEAQNDYGAVQRTDSDGRYVVERVAVDDTLPIRVHSDAAISAPGLVVTPGELDGPVQVVLSEEHGVRFRGQVVDERGAPVANAAVSIGTSYPYKSKWLDSESGLARGGSVRGCATDTEGNFVTGPLWPDLGCRISATAPGFSKAEAPYAVGKRGEVIRLAPLVLTKSQADIIGTVVDMRGQPIAGARVFAAGAGWRMAKAVSDERGAFHLSEFAADPGYLFADRVGYRLGGARVESDAADAVIVLRSESEPVPVMRQPVQLSRAQQLKLARDVLEQAWQLPTSPRSTARMGPLEAMVQIDPAWAQEMSKAAGGHFDDVVRTSLAEVAMNRNPNRAFDLLLQTRNWQGVTTALEMGKRLARSNDPADVGTAVLMAGVALELAEKVNPPRYFPPTAELFTLLGDRGQARALLDKSLEHLAKAEGGSDVSWLTETTAIALAPYDLEKSLELAGRSEEGFHRTNVLSDIAVAVAWQNLDQGIELINDIHGDANAETHRDRARLKVALDLVDSDLDRAMAVVRSCERDANRGQALGWLAMEVGALDQQKARQLIDEALAIHRQEDDAYFSWSNYGGAGPFAAALAYQAAQVGYPDMEHVVWHVLAACRAKQGRHSGQDRLKAIIGTARILAIVDQATARELLESISSQEAQIPKSDGGVCLYDQWLQAWLLVDFEHGLELLREDLQQLADSGKEDPLRYGHGAVFRLLTAPVDERFEIIIADETGLWEKDERG